MKDTSNSEEDAPVFYHKTLIEPTRILHLAQGNFISAETQHVVACHGESLTIWDKEDIIRKAQDALPSRKKESSSLALLSRPEPETPFSPLYSIALHFGKVEEMQVIPMLTNEVLDYISKPLWERGKSGKRPKGKEIPDLSSLSAILILFPRYAQVWAYDHTERGFRAVYSYDSLGEAGAPATTPCSTFHSESTSLIQFATIGNLCVTRWYAEPKDLMKTTGRKVRLAEFQPLQQDTVPIDREFVSLCAHPGFSTEKRILLSAISRNYSDQRDFLMYDFAITKNTFPRLLYRIGMDNMDPTANLIIPLSRTKVLLVGDSKVTFVEKDGLLVAHPFFEDIEDIDPEDTLDRSAPPTSWTRLSENRYLVGNLNGLLFGVTVDPSAKDSVPVETKHLELIPSPTTLLRLNNTSETNMILVGSKLGDSVFLFLPSHMERTSQKSSRRRDTNKNSPLPESRGQVVTFLPNLGPILDMTHMANQPDEPSSLLLCGGGLKDGSLRIVDFGVSLQPGEIVSLIEGANRMSHVEIRDSTGLWSHVIINTISEAIGLTFYSEEVKREKLTYLNYDNPTICLGRTLTDMNIQSFGLIQVTPESIVGCDFNSGRPFFQILPPEEENITLATIAHNMVLFATYRHLFLHSFSDEPYETKQYSFKNAIYSSDDDIASIGFFFSPETKNTVCALSTWGETAINLLIQSKKSPMRKHTLKTETSSRYLHFCNWAGSLYLFTVLQSGCLQWWRIHFGEKDILCGTARYLHLGPGEYSISDFDATCFCIIGPSTRVVHFADGDVAVNKVTVPSLHGLCSIHGTQNEKIDAPRSLLFLTESGVLQRATLGSLQPFTAQTAALAEAPVKVRSLSNYPGWISLLTRRYPGVPHLDGISSLEVRDTIRIVDVNEWEELASYALDAKSSEMAMALHVGQLGVGNDKQEYVIVATAHADVEEVMSQTGRIMVFQVESDGHLHPCTVLTEPSGVQALETIQGRLVAALGAKVTIYRWEETSGNTRELHKECFLNINVMPTCLHAESDSGLLMAGDISRSLALCQYHDLRGSLEYLAEDVVPQWVTAVAGTPQNTKDGVYYFTSFDSMNNLTISNKPNQHTESKKSQKLRILARFNVGDFINRAILNCFGAHSATPSSASLIYAKNGLLYGGVSGSLSMLVPLEGHRGTTGLDMIRHIGERMAPLETWMIRRQYQLKRSFAPSEGVVDGDLLNTFRYLSFPEQEDIVEDMNGYRNPEIETHTVESLQHLVDELTQLW